ncbi:MAG: cryptochrome/photolyase family protein [Gammaproteobacteria bacterium]
MNTTIVWFRNDLRLQDNPALFYAAERGNIIPVYIIDDAVAGQWKHGGASRWWLHRSLSALAQSFKKYHINFIIRHGDSHTVLKTLLRETNADAIYWNRRYEPWAIAQDEKMQQALPKIQSFNASLLHEPWDIKNTQGNYFKVFTPYWKHCLQRGDPQKPLPIPILKSHPITAHSEKLPSDPLWGKKFEAYWLPGEQGASQRLEDFLETDIHHYANNRNYPAKQATSCLSPHLCFGEISPRQIWYAVQPFSPDIFLSELGWREFSYHLLYHYPTLPKQPFRAEFQRFPWKAVDDTVVRRWQQGKTGYPLIDAGMRELWQTGYMHNRVRMIVASFLTKHLLIPWQIGAAWFWDTLVDADLANNSANWQWVAGCGADAAPYFRIFNPELQAKKYDPSNGYIRQWLPEKVSITPMVNHVEARNRALAAYKSLKS